MAKKGRPTVYTDKKCRDIYKSKEGMEGLNFEDFQNWYSSQRCCEYCGLTEAESELLYLNFPESTREGKRGKRLELDRKDPFKPYGADINNFVLACYWCNNAKTNYFSYEEFKTHIGPSIGIVNRKRLEILQPVAFQYFDE